MTVPVDKGLFYGGAVEDKNKIVPADEAITEETKMKEPTDVNENLAETVVKKLEKLNMTMKKYNSQQ